jgi:hypothetical protein
MNDQGTTDSEAVLISFIVFGGMIILILLTLLSEFSYYGVVYEPI